MNLLPIFCATILGITIGVAFNHKSKLNQSPEIISTAQPIPPINIYTNLQSPSQELSTTQVPTNTIVSPSTPAILNSQNISEKDLKNILSEQATLKRQLREQSQELQTLTFRVDSHSSSFQPLQQESNNTSSIPQTINTQGLTPLLPPK